MYKIFFETELISAVSTPQEVKAIIEDQDLAWWEPRYTIEMPGKGAQWPLYTFVNEFLPELAVA